MPSPPTFQGCPSQQACSIPKHSAARAMNLRMDSGGAAQRPCTPSEFLSVDGVEGYSPTSQILNDSMHLHGQSDVQSAAQDRFDATIQGGMAPAATSAEQTSSAAAAVSQGPSLVLWNPGHDDGDDSMMMVYSSESSAEETRLVHSCPQRILVLLWRL